MKAAFAFVLALVALLVLPAPSAHAQTVSLAGRMGERALLIVGGQPRTLAVGATHDGVKLLRWVGDDAEVEIGGQRALLRVGGTPSQIGAALRASARDIVINAGPGGHFTPGGAINGRAVRFLVDTGATTIALGRDEAARLGLDLSQAPTGVVGTANGAVTVHAVTLNRVRVGEVEIFNVGAVVLPQSMPYVLLGNTFLSRFQMRRDNDVMRLELK